MLMCSGQWWWLPSLYVPLFLILHASYVFNVKAVAGCGPLLNFFFARGQYDESKAQERLENSECLCNTGNCEDA